MMHGSRADDLEAGRDPENMEDDKLNMLNVLQERYNY